MRQLYPKSAQIKAMKNFSTVIKKNPDVSLAFLLQEGRLNVWVFKYPFLTKRLINVIFWATTCSKNEREIIWH